MDPDTEFVELLVIVELSEGLLVIEAHEEADIDTVDDPVEHMVIELDLL